MTGAVASPVPGEPFLTIGVFVHNEQESLGRCLRATVTAASKLQIPWEIVVVDDGSTDRTADIALIELAEVPSRVVCQENAGRAASSRQLIDLARGQFVLMLTAHVELDPDALLYWYGRAASGERLVCNGDLRTDINSVYANFWDVVTVFGWRRYFLNRGPVSYGLDDYDAYPKGTGMLVAPKAVWEAAYEQSGVEEQSHQIVVSDDTRLVRSMAARHRIWLDPQFSGSYRSHRVTLRSFLSNGFYRGTTFIDSYADSKAGIGCAVRVAPWVAVGAAVAVVVFPKVAPVVALAAVAGPVVATAAIAVACRVPARQVWWAAVTADLFAASFVAGAARGYKYRWFTRRRTHRGT